MVLIAEFYCLTNIFNCSGLYNWMEVHVLSRKGFDQIFLGQAIGSVVSWPILGTIQNTCFMLWADGITIHRLLLIFFMLQTVYSKSTDQSLVYTVCRSLFCGKQGRRRCVLFKYTHIKKQNLSFNSITHLKVHAYKVKNSVKVAVLSGTQNLHIYIEMSKIIYMYQLSMLVFILS